VAYTLPVIVLSYLKEAALLGVVTIAGANREAWRFTVIAFLTLACIVDVYWMLTVRIAVNKQEPTMVGRIPCRPNSLSDITIEVVRHALDPASPALHCLAPHRALCLACLVRRFTSRHRAANRPSSPGP